jgi:quinoprotein glucose dehydrogenase
MKCGLQIGEKKMRFLETKVLLLIVFMLLLSASCSQIAGKVPQNATDAFLPDGDRVAVKVWIGNLDIPWSLVFLPGDRALVSERSGKIRLIRNGQLVPGPYAVIDVAHRGEGGLMGLAAHPEFPEKPYVYAMHTYRKGEDVYNRVVRLKDNGTNAAIDRVILDNIPGGRFHDGGRIKFGPDGMLYITTGETFTAKLAQDLGSLGGKVLKITPEGEIPADNPFKGSPVYCYGNRNPQGIAWQPGTNRLFESEHGPSGEFGRFGHDEINVIEKGGNYGWPVVIGAAGKEPYKDPLIVWKEATPPSGMTFYSGALLKHLKSDLFVATLKSEALVRIRFAENGDEVIGIERWFARDSENGKYGRIRDVAEGPDGALYFLTNNKDGRGEPQPGDDKIYMITPR